MSDGEEKMIIDDLGDGNCPLRPVKDIKFEAFQLNLTISIN